MIFDKNKVFWNQLTEHDEQECVGITVADIVGNILGIVCDPDYSYATSFMVSGDTAGVDGTDPLAGFQAAVCYGVLPASNETFTAATMGEAYVAQFNNYPPNQVADARQYAQNGILPLGSFDDYIKYLSTYQQGAGLSMKWYPTFMGTSADGLLPEVGGAYFEHEVAVYDYDPQGDWLVIKPWLGQGFGAGGYAYMSRQRFAQVFQGGHGFNPFALRWLSLLGIASRRYPVLLSFLPTIISGILKKN